MATVNLHAEKGVVATTHADIAKRADVAIPTVYKYFPTRADLLPACMGHVASQAPGIGPYLFEKRQDVPSRLAALVHGLFEFHAFLAPWLRWALSESEVIPEIRASLDQTRTVFLELIDQAFTPGFSGPPSSPLRDVAYALLDFPAWKSMTADKNLPLDRAEAIVSDALIALFHHYKQKEERP
ncbi:MAG: helix-turn-helix transcriptional regulator [Nitrospirae bacterium]|nr:helix-turn-helix transcriptional regulator [Nitrospirota bacterium]